MASQKEKQQALRIITALLSGSEDDLEAYAPDLSGLGRGIATACLLQVVAEIKGGDNRVGAVLVMLAKSLQIVEQRREESGSQPPSTKPEGQSGVIRVDVDEVTTTKPAVYSDDLANAGAFIEAELSRQRVPHSSTRPRPPSSR